MFDPAGDLRPRTCLCVVSAAGMSRGRHSHGKMSQRQRSPVSRVLSGSLRCQDGHSSGRPVTRPLKRPDPRAPGGPPSTPGETPGACPPIRPCTGWGLPSRSGRPDRWCALTAPFHPYHRRERGVAVSFLWHCPWGRPPWTLSSTLLCGARTFLRPSQPMMSRSVRTGDHPAASGASQRASDRFDYTATPPPCRPAFSLAPCRASVPGSWRRRDGHPNRSD